MSPSPQAHDTRISQMRGLLILLVTIGHSLQWTPHIEVSDGCFRDPVFVAIYLFHVPLFFAISGLLLGRSERGKPARSRLLARIMHLAVPTIVWFLLTTLGLRLGKMADTGSLGTDLPSFKILAYGLAMHGWYIWCLCAFNALLLLPGRSLRTRAWILTAACLATTFLPDRAPVFFLTYAIAFLVPGFLLGLGSLIGVWRPSWWLRGLLITGSVLVFLTWEPREFIYLKGWSLQVDSPSGILLRFLRQALVTLTAADLLWLLSWRLNSRLLIWLGDRTLLIYLSQNLVILLIHNFLRGIPLDRRLVAWPLSLGIALLTCALGLGLERIASRNRLSSFLLGASNLTSPRMRH